MDGKITINVPDDLKKISRKKYIIRLSLLIAVYMVEVILFAVHYDKFMSAIPSYTMLNIFGMILIPAVVILFPLKKDRSWIGEIYDYKLSELAECVGWRITSMRIAIIYTIKNFFFVT